MKKLFLMFLSLILFNLNFVVEGKPTKQIKNDFASIIDESGIDKNLIAISIRDTKSGKVVYSLNDKILMHPASVQKMLTLPAAIDALGEDYEFKTTL